MATDETTRQPAGLCLSVPSWLISPEHASRMGGALWVFLWLWSQGEAGESEHVRDVRGGAAIRVEEICAGLGLPRRTIERHLSHLREAGYLTTFTERHAFSAVVNLWRPSSRPPKMAVEEGSQPPKMAVEEGSRPPKMAVEEGSRPPKMAVEEGSRPPKMAVEPPPLNPPIKEEDLLLRLPSSEGSSLDSPGFLLRTSSNKTLRANVVPIRPGVVGAGPPASSGPAVAAVAAGNSPRRQRQEQNILHHLGRIEAWERPELNATLLDRLLAVPMDRLEDVFDLCWRAHRTRNKALENPAGWWASMLKRAAEAAAKLAAQEKGSS